MLSYKKDLLEGDVSIHFLYCNAHFLLGLADAADKGKSQEIKLEKDGKLGRAALSTFNNWHETETCAQSIS